MASSSGTSTMSTEGELQLQLLMEQRKNKRKQSNRESAKRSRMRKQEHVDDLIAQVERLTKENNLILMKINITTQHYLRLESQNSVLRAQKSELSQSLQSLNHIIHLINTTDCYLSSADHNNNNYNNNNFITNPMHMACLNQPIVAAADMFLW